MKSAAVDSWNCEGPGRDGPARLHRAECGRRPDRMVRQSFGLSHHGRVVLLPPLFDPPLFIMPPLPLFWGLPPFWPPPPEVLELVQPTADVMMIALRLSAKTNMTLRRCIAAPFAKGSVPTAKKSQACPDAPIGSRVARRMGLAALASDMWIRRRAAHHPQHVHPARAEEAPHQNSGHRQKGDIEYRRVVP